jgi:Arc/MetJ family transcription regulator
MSRTNIELDDKILKEAIKLTHLKTKKEAAKKKNA